jgi:ataxia telangiectasia mutated family protein
MVDGMGPCGTEGLFVSVAEETMSLLRQHVQDLLAILSAVVADPLYKWSVKSSKAQRRRAVEERDSNHHSQSGLSNSSDKKPQATIKTINKIKEKLQGYEDSTSGEQQGIEGQVQFLINSARDPNNLCKLFHGWGPWI